MMYTAREPPKSPTRAVHAKHHSSTVIHCKSEAITTLSSLETHVPEFRGLGFGVLG